jgi:hypothetical protein
MPYLIALEDGLSGLVPGPNRVKFNVDGVLRSDLKTRYEAHAIGIDSGFLTVDEVRQLEDRPPLPETTPPMPDQAVPSDEEPV